MTSKKVALYIRVSTERQARDGYSLAAQEEELRRRCERENWCVVKVYRDGGLSGKDMDHRPGVTRLLDDAKERSFDLVLVWSLSRFTRSVSDLYNACSALNRYNTALISHTETFDSDTPSGRAMMGVMGVFAQMEIEITGERVRAAMQERARQGKRTTNCVLGYDISGPDTLRINQSEAEVVRYIYDKYLECGNMSVVAELCRLRGFRGKRGRIQTGASIQIILTRPVYAAYYRYGGDVYKGDFEPIITVKKWNEVQRKMEGCKNGRCRKHKLLRLPDN